MFTDEPLSLVRWAPLADWPCADVMARVAHHGIPLPCQYQEGFPETFECAVCPSNLNPARLAVLLQHHPEHHAETVRLARVAWDRVHGVGKGIARQLQEAEAAA